MTRIPVENRARFLVHREYPALRVLALVGLVVAWEIVARLGWVPVLFLPSPLGVIAEGREMMMSGELFVHLVASLKRLVLGFVVGGGFGVIVGVAVGFFSIAEAVGEPLIAATFPVPKIALLPLLILWLGLGEPSKVAVIALGVFFPMAINTYTGVRQADPLLVRAAVSFGARRWSVIRKVILPSALPMIFAGLRLGAGTALVPVPVRIGSPVVRVPVPVIVRVGVDGPDTDRNARAIDLGRIWSRHHGATRQEHRDQRDP